MSKRGWTTLVWVAAVVLVAGPAMAQSSITLNAGSDIFITTGGGATTVDLSQYPIVSQLLGGPPSPTVVSLSGKPIAGLGQTDTVVDRLQNVTLTAFNTPSAPVPLRLTGLSLKGQVSAGGATWNLVVSVSPNATSSGSITLTRTAADGGHFDAAINVVPHLIFTNAGNGSTVDVDCAFDCSGSIALSTQNAAWVISGGGFNPSSAGVPNIANNTPYDGDADGTADDLYKKSNFYPGFTPGTYAPVPVAHDHPPVAQHTQKPNTQCKRTASSDLDRTSGAATAVAALCVAVADPAPTEPQEPTEPTGPVVTTGG